MSGIDDHVLAVPEPAVFGTDAGAALGPQDAGGPLYSELAAGWQVGDRPPARWFNWLLRAAGNMQRAAIVGAASDLSTRCPDTPGTATTGAVVLHHPNIASGQTSAVDGSALYAFLDNVGNTAVSSNGGFDWIGGAAVGALPLLDQNLVTRDSARVIWGDASDVKYSTSQNFSGITAGATGLLTILGVITAAREGSDHAVAVDNQANVAYAADVTAAWSLASTPPSAHGSWDARPLKSLCFVGGSTYLCVTDGGQVFRSTDDGDTWALLSTVPGTTTQQCILMARCPDTGAIVAARDDTAGGGAAALYYSHDNGVSWAAATIEGSGLGWLATSDWAALKTVGGGVFLAATEVIGSTAGAVWVSPDRGQNWRRVHISGVSATNTVEPRVRAIGCDGRRMILLWENGTVDGVAHSACLDGLVTVPLMP